jgi:hypothetical protein
VGFRHGSGNGMYFRGGTGAKSVWSGTSSPSVRKQETIEEYFGVAVLPGSISAVAPVVCGAILLLFCIKSLEEGELEFSFWESFHEYRKKHLLLFCFSGDMTEPAHRIANSMPMRRWM